MKKVRGLPKFKNKREDSNKDFKDKGKRCYIVEEDSDENDDEVVYAAMKDESDVDEPTALVTYMNKNDKWRQKYVHYLYSI